MAEDGVKHTPGELIFAIFLSSICALLAAIAGLVGAIYLCGHLLSGKMTDWALILGPLAALLFGVTTFVVAFHWLVHYGDP